MTTATVKEKDNRILKFNEKERQMIIHAILLPKRATEVEIDVFINVCEKYGFDPLQKDIIFNKHEGKDGSTVSYMVTKDAWIKHAKRQTNFVKLVSGVVHENDEFELDLVEGTVKHKIVANRGNITGAWAKLSTKEGEVTEYVNFLEFYNAFSGKLNSKYGTSNNWDKVPSKMIEKTAISHLIKNQYPLGIMFTGEEDLEQLTQPFYNEPTVDINEDLIAEKQAEEKAKEIESTVSKITPAHKEEKTKPEPKAKVEEVTQKPKVDEVPVEETPVEETLSIETNVEDSQDDIQLELDGSDEVVEVAETTIEETTENLVEDEVQDDSNKYKFTFLQKASRTSASGKPTTIVTVETTDGTQAQLCAVDEMLNAFDGYVYGDTFLAEIEVEFGTVKFVKSVTMLATN